MIDRFQNMGSSSKVIRLMILVLLVIVLFKIWYYIIPSPKVVQNIPEINTFKQGKVLDDMVRKWCIDCSL